MATTRNDIPTDLTLEMGDDPSPAHFLAATRAFFGYVQEVGRTIVPDGETIRWAIHVKEGSNLVGMAPAPDTEPMFLRGAYSLAAKGIKQVESGKIEASGLSMSALAHLKTLSELAAPNGGPPPILRVWISHKPIVVSPQIAHVVDEDERANYTDYGTVEGKLEAIQDTNGRLLFRIKDAVLGQVVRCFFPETQLESAFKLFRKRIEVTGLVHYRKNGVPVSVDVATMEELPDDSTLPSAKDVRGLLKVRSR